VAKLDTDKVMVAAAKTVGSEVQKVAV